jgi:hypothetical protein
MSQALFAKRSEGHRALRKSTSTVPRKYVLSPVGRCPLDAQAFRETADLQADFLHEFTF